MIEYTNTFDDLRGDILGVLESMRDMHDAHSKLTDALATEIGRVWEDNAALRDELHALANRVETLTRARHTEPAEVAEAMVALPYPVCACGHRYDHHYHHGITFCYATRCNCAGYQPRGPQVGAA